MDADPSSCSGRGVTASTIASYNAVTYAVPTEADQLIGDHNANMEEPTQIADKIRQTPIVPEVGMAFESEDKAYEMYNTYAGKIGFSIRKSSTKYRADGSIYMKHLVCSCEGHNTDESSKGLTRTGCGARVQFSISKEGIWIVQKVELDHNHYLASPNKKKNLRSQRRVTEADKKLIGQIREAGMKPAKVFEFNRAS